MTHKTAAQFRYIGTVVYYSECCWQWLTGWILPAVEHRQPSSSCELTQARSCHSHVLPSTFKTRYNYDDVANQTDCSIVGGQTWLLQLADVRRSGFNSGQVAASVASAVWPESRQIPIGVLTPCPFLGRFNGYWSDKGIYSETLKVRTHDNVWIPRHHDTGRTLRSSMMSRTRSNRECVFRFDKRAFALAVPMHCVEFIARLRSSLIS